MPYFRGNYYTEEEIEEAMSHLYGDDLEEFRSMVKSSKSNDGMITGAIVGGIVEHSITGAVVGGLLGSLLDD